MNYRNKRPNKKQSTLIQTLDQTMMDKTFNKKIDYFGTLKKDLQSYQNEWGIKCQKECTITSKCLAKFIQTQIPKWFKSNEKDRYLQNVKYQISEEQIKARLMRALTQKIAPDDEKQLDMQCKKINMLNTEELAEAYVNRISKLLHQQIELYNNRAESIQFDQQTNYSNKTSQVCPSVVSSSQKIQNIISVNGQHQETSQSPNPFAKIQEAYAATGRRRVPVKKRSEILLKQSEATTNDPETQIQSKQATPVSGRRILNGGTIISKESFDNENKSGDASPLNNYQNKSGLNLGPFPAMNQRKLSFQSNFRNRTPVRNDSKLRLIEQATESKRQIKQITIKDIMKQQDSESGASSMPLSHQISNVSKQELEQDGEFSKLIKAMERIANHDSLIKSEQYKSSKLASDDHENEDCGSEKVQEFELMIDSVFLEKNFSTPVKQVIPDNLDQMNNFGDYVAQELENKRMRT